MITLTWSETKAFYVQTQPTSRMFYFDIGDKVGVMVQLYGISVMCYIHKEDENNYPDFNSIYKAKCNVNEAERTRITTNRLGRKLHDRFISFKTATQNSFDNTNWKRENYNDVTYIMKDINGAVTLNNAECVETWLSIEPPYDFEVAGGEISVPATLPGTEEEQDEWELFVVGAPDIPKAYGGSVEFISNPKLRFKKGQTFGVNIVLNPAEIQYSASVHSGKMLILIRHPAGAVADFQFNMTVFK